MTQNTPPPDGFGPFDDDWVNSAPRQEASADERAQRYRRIDAGHSRAQHNQWRAAGTAGSGGARGLSLARWVFAMIGIIVAILVVVWLVDVGRPLVDDGPRAYLGDDTIEHSQRSARGSLGPGDLPPPGADAAAERILPAVAPPADPGEYSFLVERDGSPVAYSPCRRLEVVVNTRGAPPGAYQAVEQAVAQMRSATGLDITVTAETDEEYTGNRDPYQPGRYGEKWAPILVTWTAANRVPEFGGDAVGLGGSLSVDPGPGPPAYVTGEITLNRDYFAAPTTAGLLKEVLLHEFGHVLGLGHVGDEAQVMTSEARGGRPLGSGDLAGLALLGQGPCTPRL